MNKKIINLTLPIVTREIEYVLATYPRYPYQQAFTSSGLLLDLIAYVLSRIPNTYTVIEETKSSSNNQVSDRCSTEQLLDIENLIHLGIRDVLDVHRQTSEHLPQMFEVPSVLADFLA